MNAVELDGVGFAYLPGEWVIRDLSASVEAGSTLAILGPNGRGKSTLLRLLLGTLQPQEGRVSMQTRPAFVPQLFDAAVNYSVLDMVLMGRARHVGLLSQPRRVDAEAALVALDRLGIGDLASRGFQSLSGGQRQLVILARAIVSEARVLLLDEPTSALDFRNQSIVLGWIRRLARDEGWTVVFTTHNPQHALAVAERVLLMHDAGNAEYLPSSVALEADRLSRLYGHPMARGLISDAEGGDVEVIAPLL